MSCARARVQSDLGGGRFRRWISRIELWLEPRSIGFAFHNEVVRRVFESIDGTLCEKDVVEHCDPLRGVTVAGDDRRSTSGALKEELVDVLALLLSHRLEREVIEDEKVDRGERDHFCFARVIQSTLSKPPQHVVAPCEAHVVAVTASDVTESLGDEGLVHVDGPKHVDVLVCFEEAQAHELGEHALVEGDLRCLIPKLQPHRRVEPRLVGADVGGSVVAPRDLIGEHEQQEIIERHVLLVGEYHPIGQGLDDASKLQAFESGDQLGADRGRGFHQTPSFFFDPGRVWNCSSERAKRGTVSCTSLPLLPPPSDGSGLVANLSIRVMRPTSTTSKASALWQTASTRPSPYLSQRRRRA